MAISKSTCFTANGPLQVRGAYKLSLFLSHSLREHSYYGEEREN